jgi:hypothetical protein
MVSIPDLLEVLMGSSFKYLIVTLLCADLQFLSHPVLGDLLTEDDQQVPLLGMLLALWIFF